MKTRTCRGCEGDGHVEADEDTPSNERLSHHSRRCPYCGGRGYVVERQCTCGSKSGVFHTSSCAILPKGYDPYER